MPHQLRIIRPVAAAPVVGTQVIDPTLPLLHPCFRHDFQWGSQLGGIHAQRIKAGDLRPHPEWFYLRLTDGSYHEVQFARLRKFLTHTPEFGTTPCLAAAFEQEPIQTPERLAGIARLCGL